MSNEAALATSRLRFPQVFIISRYNRLAAAQGCIYVIRLTLCRYRYNCLAWKLQLTKGESQIGKYAGTRAGGSPGDILC